VTEKDTKLDGVPRSFNL